MALKQTALYQEHLKLNGKMVEFGGWMMPVQYTGISDEHETCRQKVGLFDVSHMGEVRIRGKGALDYVNHLVTNNVANIHDNQCQYSTMCYDNGGCVDDLIVHRINVDDIFICVNASNSDKDFEWMKSHAPKHLSVENHSPQYTQIAIQGRHAQTILQKFTDTPLADIKYYWFRQGKVLGNQAIIARTGYTGEDGLEIYIPWDKGPQAWQALYEEGQKYGLKPVGLGARDTLRTEMKFPLYGHEISQDLNPIEAGLGWVVKLDKPDFIGKKALVQIKERGLRHTIVGLVSKTKAIPRPGYKIEVGGTETGFVTSGTLAPSLKTGIAIAYVKPEHARLGTKVNVNIRGQLHEHEVVPTPFYQRPY